jgi:zinc transport system substrate-binding protein
MKIVLILAALCGLLAGCGGDDASDAGGRVRVAASFYPLAEAVRQVGGDRVDVTDLTPPGVEPHDLELSPDDVDAILDADLAVLLTQGFQPAVEDVANDRDGPVLHTLSFEASDPDASPDPHVWLDPTRFAEIVKAIGVALGKVDPPRAAFYKRNAEVYAGTLADLDADFAKGLGGLDDCRTRQIITAHAAFGWLAKRYGLDQQAIAGLSPDQEPDPARLAELADLVRENGLTTIFTEELVSPEVAESLAREAGVRTAVLNPLESQPEKGDYVSVMRANLDTLEEALGCTS